MSSPDRLDPVARLSPTESAEILRTALPKMTAHGDGYDPASYSVWFEYVRGGLADLKKEVDAIVAQNRRLTGAETRALFDAHIRDRSEKAFNTARSRFIAMLSQMRAAIESAESSGADFEAILEQFGSVLDQTEPGPDFAATVEHVAAGTAQIRRSMQALTTELAGNQAEIDRLTSELMRLREDVRTDPLTALANRRGFDAAIEKLKAAVGGDGADCALAMMDIDHFKHVNDSHGHVVGDRVLQRIATTMKACVRGGDTCARYGGEEFALLLPATSASGAQTVVDNIRSALRRAQVPTLKQGVVSNVTMSAGIATLVPGESIDSWIRRADQALYQAKREGRDRVVIV